MSAATPRPTRLLLAVHSALRGGAQHVALAQARALRDECELVIAVGHGPLRPDFAEVATALEDGPVNLPIWGASPGRWALQIARSFPDALRCAWLVWRHRIDVVVVNSTVLVAPVVGARLAGVPVIVHVQEAPTSEAARRLFRVHAALADTVVAISPWIAQSLAGGRAKVLLNPVGIAVPPDPGPRELFAGDPVRLVVVGTLDRHKRQDLAIATLHELRESGIPAELTLVGPESDPAYAVALRRQARDLPVHFAGQADDVAGWLQAADVLLLPAGEVTPLVLMEAMALRTPVVAARMGSIPDVVDEVLVDPGDPEAMAAGVARLRDDPALAARLAESGRRRVEADFDAQRSHRRLSAEIASRASGSIPLRRRLGGAWRQTRAAGLRWRLRVSRARVGGALVYHATFATPPHGEQVVPAITGAALERHLRHLRRSYRLVTASQLYSATLARRRGARIPIAVTFDDDLASHGEVAAPLLRRLGCPATFFLTGAGQAFWWQRLQAAADRGLDPRPALRAAGLDAADGQPLAALAHEVELAPAAVRAAAGSSLARLIGEDPPAYRLTPEQVAALAGAGFEIGFHTREHRPLPELGDDALERALDDGRDALVAAAGRPLRAIAYPHGRADEGVAAAARAAGYSDGFGGPERTVTSRSDRLLLGRMELLLEEAGSFALSLATGLWADR